MFSVIPHQDSCLEASESFSDQGQESRETMMKEEEQAYLDEERNDVKLETDTSQTYAEVFGETKDFDSWEDFTILMEEFQKKSGSSFKLKSASCVDYINEKRVNDQIPERFVYAKVKLICIHFGLPTIRGSGHRKNYVGKGCGAFMHVGFNRGALRISSTNLVHTNHPLGQDGQSLPLRQFRMFNFNDELDFIIAKEVMKNNPFEYINGDKKWLQAVTDLKNIDERLATITSRLVKKRIRLLMDRFLTVSNGNPPVAEDEMGKILYELDKTRKETLSNSSRRGRGNGTKKNSSYYEDNGDDDDIFDEYAEEVSSDRGNARDKPTTSRSTGSKRIIKKRNLGAEFVKMEDGDDDGDSLAELLSDEDEDPTFQARRKKAVAPSSSAGRGRPRRGRPCKKPPVATARIINADEDDSNAHKRPRPSNPSIDLKVLIKYFSRKDEQQRELRQQEINLRKEELSIFKTEMELQKERFEWEKKERKTLLDYLQAQSQAFASSMSHTNARSHLTETSGQVTEYTILVDK